MGGEDFGFYCSKVKAAFALFGVGNAACNAIADGLEEGQSSVGTKLDVSHDAATPVGMHVTAKAELVEVDRRRLVFRVTAEDDAGPIGQGTHERFLIMADKFLAKAEAKKG
jgi:fluoroacetyl-CoA thioesterase